MLGRKYESSLSNFFLHIKHTSKKSFIIIRADLCNLWEVNIYCFICFECFIYIEISVQICAIRGNLNLAESACRIIILEIRVIRGTLISFRGRFIFQ